MIVRLNPLVSNARVNCGFYFINHVSFRSGTQSEPLLGQTWDEGLLPVRFRIIFDIVTELTLYFFASSDTQPRFLTRRRQCWYIWFFVSVSKCPFAPIRESDEATILQIFSHDKLIGVI